MRASVRGSAFAVMVALGIVWLTSDIALGRQGCVTGFSPSTLNVPVSGGTVSFTVLTSSSTCQWNFGRFELPDGTTLMIPPPWMGNFPSPFGATGQVTASLTVLPNHEGSPRNITLFYQGQPLPLTQPGNPCALTLSATSPANMPANGGTGSFTVSTSGSPCSYTVLAGDGVTIVSGGSGSTFPATVTFSVGPNTTQQPVNRAVYVSSFGTVFFAPGVGIVQNGPPVATDAPASGFVFAVHRPSAGSPHVSSPEPLRITNTESPTASWTATTSEPWLVVSPASGTSPAVATISLDPAAVAVLTKGTYVGTLNITSSVAPSVARSIWVQLRITDATSMTQSPSGFLDIPVEGGADLSGAVAVGGWAADDVGIARVLIFRNSVSGEPAGEIFLGDGTRVRGARPDVVAQVTAPGVTSAGWGLMVLSNVLPNGGNGTFTLSAYAEDVEGHQSLLGRKTVTFNNNGSPFPFGTIDRPAQGATVSGTYNNQGWILAQPGRFVPFDGSTIRLFIDGVAQPHVAGYGFARPDVAALFPFPTYANANGPAVQFTFDTTQFADGLHTIVWVVSDDMGVIQGIGSRYVNIQNGSASQAAAPRTLEARSAAVVRALPQADAFVWNRQGFDERGWSLQVAGGRTNEIRQKPGERLEVALDTWWWSAGCGPYAAYLMTGDVAGPLPPGASIDGDQGVFRWLPPAEFAGTFELVFVRRACTGQEERIPLRVTIAPR